MFTCELSKQSPRGTESSVCVLLARRREMFEIMNDGNVCQHKPDISGKVSSYLPFRTWTFIVCELAFDGKQMYFPLSDERAL